MTTRLPPILETKLAEFRRRVWAVKLVEGLLGGLFGLVLSYLLVFACDRFFETPRALRLVLLSVGAAALGLGLPLKWHRWVWQQRRLEDAARLLRRTFPRLGDQLLGIVELARMDHAAAGRSERLVEAAMAQAAEAVKDRDFTDAVPEARHRQWGWAAAGVAALTVLAFAVVSEAARNAARRWLTPWRTVERYTFARIDPLPERLVVPYAEPFTLPVRLAPESKRAPQRASARIGDQPRVQAPLDAGGYALSFPPQKVDAPLTIALGDVRASLPLLPRPRPELAELAVRLKLPAYLEYKTEPRLEIRGGTVSVLAGAEAAFEARASRPLAAAALDGAPQRVDGERILTDFATVRGDATRIFSWQDQDGLTPREPLALKVRALDDEAPRIAARRETIEQVVLDSEVVTFDLSASDDFGIKRVGLEWAGTRTEKPGGKIAAAGEPEKRELAARATFCAAREGVAPQTLEVRAWADDYLPGRERSRSASFVLHVLDKTDHALWLTEQFGKWLGAARESYEREQQLHQTNRELRELSTADLDRPENRRRVAQQAAAEKANATRVESLTNSGRNLVEQATKNPEFDADRLESWATMLKSLKDIAASRMPSVAELLQQSASAAAGMDSPGNAQPNPSGKPSEGRSESAPSVAQGAPQPGQPAGPPSDAGEKPAPSLPNIADREPGFRKPAAPDEAKKSGAPSGSGKLSLPQTQLAAVPKKDDAPPESPAQEKLDQAITEQRDLLAEFAKVSDRLSDIQASLEASTFVKRLKAASRQQMNIASEISQQTLDAFGIERTPVKAAEPIAQHARDQSKTVGVIQSDLDAYAQRKPDAHFKRILEQMKKTEIVQSLARGGERVTMNLTGQGLVGAEYWADVLDRWAEEMVGASKSESSSAASSDSLPPEIVLKVMQALRDEMKLRDETREMENARPALPAEKFTADARTLGDKQAAVALHTAGAIEDIRGLPDGAKKFRDEIGLLNAVVAVMDEAQGILAKPETGAPAIAAETEAIELLLQAKRSNPNGGGGGGGSNPGGGGRAGAASSTALAELGPGADAESSIAPRAVGQATGRAGREFPEEFKAGLDAYFSRLEKRTAE